MSTRNKSNHIRIIGGQWRSRRLPVLDEQGLRPTTDRVRETLFNWLMHELSGARCLDLFAGSGALGLEALSRGAEFVQFVELVKPSAGQIEQNLAILLDRPVETADVHRGDAIAYLREQSTAFDLVFLDPPFGTTLLVDAIDALANSDALSTGALVYIEQDATADSPSLPDHWSLHREAQAGRCRFALYRA